MLNGLTLRKVHNNFMIKVERSYRSEHLIGDRTDRLRFGLLSTYIYTLESEHKDICRCNLCGKSIVGKPKYYIISEIDPTGNIIDIRIPYCSYRCEIADVL